MSRISYLNLSKVTSSFNGEIEAAVTNAVSSGWYLHGKATETFERNYAHFLGCDFAVGCASGLDALYLMLRAYVELGRISPGNEVIVPSNTFIATINAVVDAGLVPVLVNPDESTCNINPDLIEAAISERTAAVLLVHLYGRNAYTPKIDEICRSHGLLLFEDNAQAHGCFATDGRRTGSLGDAAAHSFYPGKNLGALGDAGCVTTSDSEVAEMVRTLGNYGSSRKYVFDYVGRNSRMDELQAAALTVKLKRLDADNNRRRQLAKRYINEISNPLIEVPHVDDFAGHVFHIFPVHSPERDRLQSHFSNMGIETLIHYPIPPHRQKCYEGKNILRLPLGADGMPDLHLTERLHLTELSLPLSQVLTDEEASRIIEAANSFR